VINGRYAKNAPTIMTTNFDFKELGDYLGDPMITTTIVDRLVHHAIILNVIGPSYRAYQSELLNKAEKAKTRVSPEATREAPLSPEAPLLPETPPRDPEPKTKRRKSPKDDKPVSPEATTRHAPPPPAASPRDPEPKTKRRKSPMHNKREKGDLHP